MHIKHILNLFKTVHLTKGRLFEVSQKRVIHTTAIRTSNTIMGKRLFAGNSSNSSHLEKKPKTTLVDLEDIDRLLSESDDWDDSEDLEILNNSAFNITSRNQQSVPSTSSDQKIVVSIPDCDETNGTDKSKEISSMIDDDLDNILDKYTPSSNNRNKPTDFAQKPTVTLAANPLIGNVSNPTQLVGTSRFHTETQTVPIQNNIELQIAEQNHMDRKWKSEPHVPEGIDDEDMLMQMQDEINAENENIKPIPADITDDMAQDSSIEMYAEQPKTKLSNKFTFATQLPSVVDSKDGTPEELNLPPNTKIKIPIRLSVEQEQIIDLAEKGYNIFYTGSAGTGKSILLKELIKRLKKKYGPQHVAVTASTGLAACNIGGFTIHSYTGIGLGKGDADVLYKKVRRSKKHLRRWEEMSALVVDEISMLDGDLLDKLDTIAQKVRRNHEPFGGIQLIFCGDFFQLPPVSKDPMNPTKFAFESNSWKSSIDITIMLERVFRQQGDLKFIDMLNKMRLGSIDEETEMEFKKLNRALPDDDIIPAELYSTRREVDRANGSRLAKLPGKSRIFKAIDGGDLQDKDLRDKLLQNFLSPQILHLKPGAQVMMIKNIDATLVNGSLGKVIDFMDADTYLFYDVITNNPEAPLENLDALRNDPAKLEMLREADNDDDDKARKNKMTKESFSRLSSNEVVTELDDNIFDFLADAEPNDQATRDNIKRKRAWLNELHLSSQGRKLPLVRFKMADMTTRTVLVEPEEWAIEDEKEKPLVSRVQLPLMLAWSLSIHKSQGQTLPKVKVDLGRVFEKGQAYVALSRAVSREGLQVINFSRTKVGAHDKVVQFYNTLTSAETALAKLGNDPPEKKRNGYKPQFAPKTSSSRYSYSKKKPATKEGGILGMLMTRKEKSKH